MRGNPRCIIKRLVESLLINLSDVEASLLLTGKSIRTYSPNFSFRREIKRLKLSY